MANDLEILAKFAADIQESLAQLRSDFEQIKIKFGHQQLPITLKVDKVASDAQIKADLKSLARQKIEIDAKLNTDAAKKQIENIKVNPDAAQNLNQVGSSLNTVNTKSAAAVGSVMLLHQAFNALRRSARQMVETAVDLDKQLTNLRMITGQSYTDASRLVDSYNTLARELNATTSQVLDTADAWLRQGKSVAETEELIRQSVILSKVGMMDSSTAAERLTSTMKGYNLAVSDVAGVVDKLTALDMAAAVSADGLAESLSHTASSASLAGVNLDKILSYIAVAGETTQKSASVVGESFKSLFARIQKVTAGADTDDFGNDISQVETTLRSLGVELRKSETEFRSMDEVLDEIGGKFNSLDSVIQKKIATAMGGVYQSENLLALLKNYDKVAEYVDIAANSAGTAAEKFEAYGESIEAHWNTLVASAEALSKQTVPPELIKGFLDAGTAILDFAENTNILVIALSGLGSALAVKGITAFVGKIRNLYDNIARLSSAFNILSNAANVTLSASEFDQLLIVTKGLNTAQLQLIISSKALTTEQRMAILTANGMTQAEAAETLATMGLTTAEGAATAATFSLSGAFKALTAAIASNPIGFIVVALTTLISVAATAASKMREAEAEASAAAIAQADAAKALSDNISDLVTQYLDLSNAVATDEAAKSQLLTVQDNLIDSLGIERDKVADLVAEYGNLSDAIKQASIDKLQEAERDLRGGLNEHEDKLLEKAKAYGLGSYSMNHIIATWADQSAEQQEANIRAQRALHEAGFISAGAATGTLGMELVLPYTGEYDLSTVDGIINSYGRLASMLDAVNDAAGSDNEVYRALYAQYTRVTEAINNYQDGVAALNNNLAQQYMLQSMLDGNIPTTKAEFSKYRRDIIASASATHQFAGSVSDFESALDGLLSKQQQFSDFYSELEGVRSKLMTALGYNPEMSTSAMESWYAKVGNWLDELSDEDIQILYGIYLNEDTAAWSIDDFKAALAEAKAEAVAFDLSRALDSYEALKSQVDAVTDARAMQSTVIEDNIRLSDAEYKAISSLVGGEEQLKGIIDAQNGNLITDAEALRELAAKTEIATYRNVKLAASHEKLKYHQLVKQLRDLATSSDRYDAATNRLINDTTKQLRQVDLQIAKYEQLKIQLLGTADGFEAIANAKKFDEAFDYTDELAGAIKNVIDLFHTGWNGREEFQESFFQLIPEDVYSQYTDLADQYKAGYDYLTNELSRYYTLKDGTISIERDNVINFITDALSRPIDDDPLETLFLGTLDDFRLNPALEGQIDKFTRAMHMEEVTLYGMLTGVANVAVGGREILESLTSGSLESSILEADQAMAKLLDDRVSLIRSGEADGENGRAELEKISDDLLALDKQMQGLGKDALDNLRKHLTINPLLEEAEQNVRQLQAQLDELSIKGLGDGELKFDDLTAQLQEAKDAFIDLQIQKYALEEPTELQISIALEELDRQIDAKQAELDALTVDVKANPEAIHQLEAELDELKADRSKIELFVGISDEDLMEQMISFDEFEFKTKKIPVDYSDLSKAIRLLRELPGLTNGTKKLTLDVEGADKLYAIANLIAKLPFKSTSTQVSENVSSSAEHKTMSGNQEYADGTAHAKGSWGLPHDEHGSLVAELGPELRVNREAGTYEIMGLHGAEFRNLNKDDIIFDHKQTQEMLRRGHIRSRGKLVSGGNAFVDGKAHASVVPLIGNNTPNTGNTGGVSEDLSESVDDIRDAFDNLRSALAEQITLLEHQFDDISRKVENGISANPNIDRYRSIYDDYIGLLREASALGVDPTKTVYSNIDTNNRQVLEWTEENLEKYRDIIESWGESIDDYRDTISTVLGTTAQYDGVEIAYSPILQTDTGPVLLNDETVDKYIFGLLEKGGNDWTAEDLFKLDAEGIEIDGVRIQKLIADIGDTAIQTSQAMHFTGKDGAILQAFREVESAAHDAGVSVEVFMTAMENHNTELLSVYEIEDNLRRRSEMYHSIMAEAHNAAEALREYYRTQGMADDEIEKQIDIIELRNIWYEAYESDLELAEKKTEIFAKVLSELSDQLDEVQGIYSTLRNAADEYAATGEVSIDTFQTLTSYGLEYLNLLKNEDGELVINEERIKAVIAAKLEQYAVENALAYVMALRQAKESGETAELERLLYATNAVTGATWDLVDAVLAQIDLTDEQRQAARNTLNSYKALAKSAAASIGLSASTASDALQKMKSGMDDIVNYTMSMLKQRTEDQIDAIEDMKKSYSELIDHKKKSLRLTQSENSYQRNLRDKLKEIANLQAQIDILSLDNSREAQAQRAKLAEELYSLQNDLADAQEDHYIEAQEKALDEMQKSYEDQKDAEIDVLEKSISSQEKLYQKAIAYIRENWNKLYNELIAWNTEYGTVINDDITKSWEEATKAVERYDDAVTAISSIENDIADANLSGKSVSLGRITEDTASTNPASLSSGNKMYLVGSDEHAPSSAKAGDYVVTGGGLFRIGEDGKGILVSDQYTTSDVNELPTLFDKYKAMLDGERTTSSVASSGISMVNGHKIGVAVNGSRPDGFTVGDYVVTGNGLYQIGEDNVGKLIDSQFQTGDASLLPEILETYKALLSNGGVRGYKNGVEADFTGLAMLHGTPTKPEAVLNSKQYSSLTEFLENMPDLTERMHDFFNYITHRTLPQGVDMMRYPTPASTGMTNIQPNAVNNIEFGDVYITGTNEETAQQHMDINRDFMNQIVKKLGLKK